MTILRAIVGASALFLLAPLPQAQASCTTVEVCFNLVVVNGCVTWESCGGDDETQNETVT